jgi:hypothetical protein
MSMLLLALALAAPAAASEEARSSRHVSCSVTVTALDGQGHERSARRVSAGHAPAVVFRGRVSGQDADTPPLLFDVFNPRGQRYQILVAGPGVVRQRRGAYRIERATHTREAALAVAGSSIAWTSMFGRWRVQPRLEGADEPCGKAEYFTIRP